MNSTGAAPGSQSSLREMNRLRVLDAVTVHGALTQVEIASVTGLSAATVSNMVRELSSAGAVDLAPSVRNGRRATLVSLAAPSGFTAGVVFADRDVRVVIGTGGEIVRQKRMPLPADYTADETLVRAGRLLHDLLDEAGHSAADLHAISIGLPAPIDALSGHIGSDGILPGWRGVDVATEMNRVLDVPARVENTANLAAYGEFKYGSLQSVSNGVFLNVSYGVGAGLILSGDLYRGSAGTAGEIGHITMDEDGPICRCGNRGCLETFVGAGAVLDSLRGVHGVLTLRDVISRALDGDAPCRRVLGDAGRHLGIAVAGVVNLLNPDVVVLGGQVARVGEIVLEPMREAIDRSAIPSAAKSMRVLASSLADDAEVRGALALADALREEAGRATLGT